MILRHPVPVFKPSFHGDQTTLILFYKNANSEINRLHGPAAAKKEGLLATEEPLLRFSGIKKAPAFFMRALPP
jgi:hypothetical protein